MAYDPYNTQVTSIGGGPTRENFVMFQGYSDDLVHVTTTNQEEEYNVSFLHGLDIDSAVFIVEAPGGGMRIKVIAIYDGTWSFAPGLVKENDIFPNWNMQLNNTHPYSMMFRMVVPPGTRVRRVNGRGETLEGDTQLTA